MRLSTPSLKILGIPSGRIDPEERRLRQVRLRRVVRTRAPQSSDYQAGRPGAFQTARQPGDPATACYQLGIASQLSPTATSATSAAVRRIVRGGGWRPRALTSGPKKISGCGNFASAFFWARRGFFRWGLLPFARGRDTPVTAVCLPPWAQVANPTHRNLAPPSGC